MKLFWVVMMLAVTAGAVRAYDPPRIIGVLQYEQWGPSDYCSIGDQNGDGKDDLLVCATQRDRFEIFLGGDRLGPECNYTIPSQHGINEQLGYVLNIGRLFDRESRAFATWSKVLVDSLSIIELYNHFDPNDETPTDTWGSNIWTSWETWSFGKRMKPFDFNGDGYNDIVMSRMTGTTTGFVDVYYGGDGFDSIPDWSSRFRISSATDINGFEFSTGCDVNGDGYDDIMIRGFGPHENNDQDYFYAIFLGGAEPDTAPVVKIWDGDFQGWERPVVMESGFSLIKDINGDGYDDFGIYYYDATQDGLSFRDGIYVFFGDEVIHNQPDLILTGGKLGVTSECEFTTGDFNGDGMGDIVAGLYDNPPLVEEINYYFGNRNLSVEPDIVLNDASYGHQYGGLLREVGAVGDYNGDGCDDIVVPTYNYQLVILAGNRDWQVNAPKDLPPPKEFIYDMGVSPNPFNSTTSISFTIPRASHVSLSIYDLAGRLVTEPFSGEAAAGPHSIVWQAPVAGLYWVVVSNENGERKVIKAVCLP